MSTMRLAILGGLALFLAIFLLFSIGPGSKRELNILLISLDSTRPDHLGAYGYGKNTSPNMDRVASEGVLFKRAYSSAPWTNPSLISVLTSLRPSAHGVIGRGKFLSEALDTPVEIMKRRGYAAPAMSYLATTPDYVNAGFETVQEKDPVEWLEKNKGKKFFLWLHFVKPHLPYNPEAEYEKKFAPPDAVVARADPAVIDKVRRNVIIQRGEFALGEADKEVIKGLYDAEIREADEEIGAFLKEMDSRGLLNETLLVITADHGEEFFERGWIGHASTNKSGTLYNELIRVPLIFRLPGKLPAGKVVEEPAEGIDVMPTIFELAGIPLEPYFQGRSLLPQIFGLKGSGKRVIFAETTPCGYQCKDENEPARIRAAIDGGWKLIETSRDGSIRYELYNLSADPGERLDLVEKERGVAGRLKAELAGNTSRSAQLGKAIRSSEASIVAARGESTSQKPRPRTSIIRPVMGEILTRDTFGGKIMVQWTGDPHGDYKVQYDVGAKEYNLKGFLTVRGNKKEYGPFAASYWRKFQLYNPWKFRVAPVGDVDNWSEWVDFKVENSGG